jgi:hypothetical protein
LLRYLPNDKADMNSADLPGTNHDYPEASRERRREIATRHREYALGLLYFLQNDDAVPDEVQSAARAWGLATDEFTDTDNFPWQLYVREARRLDGRVAFTESDARHAPGLDRTPVHDDAIAIAEYPLDSHACHEDRQLGSQREGFFFASQVTRPSQVPYRALLPKDLDNLLVPVPLSATHVGYGTIRLEPTWFHIGEATGFAAAQARETERQPANIDTDELQRTLAQRGVMLSFFNGVAMDDAQSWLPAVQYLGTKGYFHSYDARPDESLDAGLARAWAERTAALLDGDAAEATTFARRVADLEDGPSTDTISVPEFVSLLERALACEGLDEPVPDAVSVSSDTPLTRGGACELLYGVLGR